MHDELVDILAEVASDAEDELSPIPWGQGIPDPAVSRAAASRRGSP
jgi:hypothetical protein